MLDLITHVTVLLCTAYCPPAPTLAGRVSPVTGKHGATETRFWLFSLRPGSPVAGISQTLPRIEICPVSEVAGALQKHPTFVLTQHEVLFHSAINILKNAELPPQSHS